MLNVKHSYRKLFNTTHALVPGSEALLKYIPKAQEGYEGEGVPVIRIDQAAIEL